LRKSISISIPPELKETLDNYKDIFNYSEIFREAVEKKIDSHNEEILLKAVKTIYLWEDSKYEPVNDPIWADLKKPETVNSTRKKAGLEPLDEKECTKKPIDHELISAAEEFLRLVELFGTHVPGWEKVHKSVSKIIKKDRE
jgi:Iap family predicted aminopeptidase